MTVSGIYDADQDPDIALYTPARLAQQAYYPSSWQADYQYDEYGNTTGYTTTYSFNIPNSEFQRSGLLQDLVAFGLGSSSFTAWVPIQGEISTADFTNSSLPEPPGVETVPGMLDIKGGQLTLSNTVDGTPGALFYYSSNALVSLGNKEYFSWYWSSPNPNILGSMHFPMSLSSSGSLELRDFEGGYINLYPTSGQIVVHGLSGGGAIYIEGSRVATEAYVSSVTPSLSYLSSTYMPKSPLSLGVGLNSSTLNGSGASALGQASTAHGDSAFAAGKGASALGESAVAMGGGARATQSGNIAIGQGSVSTGQPTMWQGAATGSVAVGTKAEATREVSSAFGPLARAYALESTAVGPLTRAAGPYSLAAGSTTYTETTAVGGGGDRLHRGKHEPVCGSSGPSGLRLWRTCQRHGILGVFARK